MKVIYKFYYFYHKNNSVMKLILFLFLIKEHSGITRGVQHENFHIFTPLKKTVE